MTVRVRDRMDLREIVGEEHRPKRRAARPPEEWVVGSCPYCKEDLVSNCYYHQNRGYQILTQCWGSLGSYPTCTFRRTI